MKITHTNMGFKTIAADIRENLIDKMLYTTKEAIAKIDDERIKNLEELTYPLAEPERTAHLVYKEKLTDISERDDYIVMVFRKIKKATALAEKERFVEAYKNKRQHADGELDNISVNDYEDVVIGELDLNMKESFFNKLSTIVDITMQ